ncbi:carbohydrate sulfotransferase 1-like [Mercenaria mercenaria]|uniref:carbohydrate sulfotransferase 1-like n=1 Tax=Mercenaria mercenaria TaxID=6596 RepID=UPI001E1D8388|nr:carbohydrate sulfotransferase 1-like [Mercenaria mercenaria]
MKIIPRLLTAFALLLFFRIHYQKTYDGMQIMKASGNISQFIKRERYVESDTIILILAYSRTGSTFVGSIFREIPGSFYLYEPIRNLLYTFEMKVDGTFSDLNRNPRWHNKTQEMEVSLQEINCWVSCNLSSVCLPIQLENDSTPNVHGCCGREAFNSCLKAEEAYCENASVKVMKFIRLRMRSLIILLQSHANMKVIHLVRDPRGIMSSSVFIRSTSQDVHKHCYNLLDDLKHSKKILLQYPERLLIVNYENLADYPIRTAREMFQFAGFNLSTKIKDYIKRQTSADRDYCIYCTKRKNSSATAMKWRTQLSANSARFIYNACGRTNKVLGYLQLSSENTIRNYSFPSRKLVDIHQELLSDTYF